MLNKKIILSIICGIWMQFLNAQTITLKGIEIEQEAFLMDFKFNYLNIKGSASTPTKKC
ncbi:MAG: hypothetical protein IBX66_10210 [Lutibacter sp.]|nr:hypothetical protein [Lutibacter sp.]